MTPGTAASLASRSLTERRPLGRSVEVRLRQRHIHDQHATGIEAGFDADEPADALDHQAGGDQDDERQSDFDADEHAAQTGESRRCCRDRPRLSSRCRMRTREAEHRREAEEHAGQAAMPNVNASTTGSTSAPARRPERREPDARAAAFGMTTGAEPRHPIPASAADKRQQEPFGQQLRARRPRPAPSAERMANSRCRARRLSAAADWRR